MNVGKYVFAHCAVSPETLLRTTGKKHKDRTARMAPSYWSHMLVIVGQLIGGHRLGELTDITVAHAKRSFGIWKGSHQQKRSFQSEQHQKPGNL